MASAPRDNRDLVALGPVRRGRQTIYSDAVADEICARIAEGETLTAICEDENMPGRRTITDWLMRDEHGFAARYARAREAQADVEADQIREIGDDLAILPEHKRIMVDARKWRAERLNRRVYGNSVQHQHEVAVHPAAGAEQVPAGIGWLAQFLPGGDAEAGPEPDTGGVGEE